MSDPNAIPVAVRIGRLRCAGCGHETGTFERGWGAFAMRVTAGIPRIAVLCATCAVDAPSREIRRHDTSV